MNKKTHKHSHAHEHDNETASRMNYHNEMQDHPHHHWPNREEFSHHPGDRNHLIENCSHPQLEYIGDPDPLTDLRCTTCPWQASIDTDPVTT